MVIKLSKNISVWSEFNPLELSSEENILNPTNSRKNLARLGFNQQRILIKNRWFDVLDLGQLVRKRNPDGYYRAIYIQINWDNGEYYIGKVNRPKWSELKRYQGSGLKFSNKYRNSKSSFARYFVAVCEIAEDTELLEASIVDEDLLADEKCLNLVAGGGGTSKRPTVAETSEKKRLYMKNHPEQFKPMLEAAKKAFRSGDTPALRARSRRIKEVMGTEKYRKMSADRIKKWATENPEAYAEARRKNREAIKTPEREKKRKASFEKWVESNPERYRVWQEKLIASRSSKEVTEKRKASLKNWNKENSEQSKANANKRAKAAAAKLSKRVCMIDLYSGKVLRRFSSQHEAAKWLVKNGKAKNMNCVSSISSVCLRKRCTTGYGYRKKAFGYSWRFAAEVEADPPKVLGGQQLKLF